MEKLSEENLPEGAIADTEIKKSSNADVPAEEIEDNNHSEEDTESDSDSNSESDSDSDSDDEYECTVCEKTFSGYLPFRQHLKGKKHARTLLRKKKIKKQTDVVNECYEELLVQEPYIDCKICCKDFYGPESYKQHLKSKKHKRKVLEAFILDKVQEGGKVNVEKLRDMFRNEQTVNDALENSKDKIASLALAVEDDDDKKQFDCKECEKEFSGLVPFTQHLTSKSHAKKVGQKHLLEKVIPDTPKEAEISLKTKQENISALCMEDDILVCKVCTTSFSGPENAMTHMKSKKHAKNWGKYLRKLERKKNKAKDADKKEKDADKKEKLEDEDDIKTEKIQSTSEECVRSQVSNLSQSNSSASSSDVNAAYSNYKEYKEIMNSIPENDKMK